MRYVRTNVKKSGAAISASLLRSKSYPIFGIPGGITKIEPTIFDQVASYPEEFTPIHSVQTYRDKKFEPCSKVEQEGIFSIYNGIATATGGNLNPKGKLVSTFLQVIDGKPIDQHELFYFSTSRFFPRIYQAKESVISLTAGWQGAFYHWMYQILPRLELVPKPYPIVYADQSFSFQKESLEMLGIKRVIAANVYPAIQSPQIFVPSQPTNPTKRTCQFLRDQFLPHLPKGEKKRLYISRSDAKTRRIANEAELLPILEKYGFEKVSLSGSSMLEQMQLFRNAEMIVAPHGAGLSHLVFCDPKTPLLECFQKEYVNPCYWHIASQVDLKYHLLFDMTERSGIDPDMTLDPKQFESSLRAMENDHTRR